MSDLKTRQDKMKQVKKQNSYKDFLQELVSRYPIVIYKNQGLLSIYPETERACPLVTTKAFEEKRASYTDHGIDYDFTLGFFDNFKKLYAATPFPALYNYTWAENSEYAFAAYMSKNCYLSFTVITNCENVLYGFTVKEGCTNVLNSSQIWNNSQNIYQCLWVYNSSNVFYSRYIDNSSDMWFSSNMIGCHHCCMCDGLENASYYIKNKQYSKEEYKKEFDKILSQKQFFADFYSQVSCDGYNYWSNNVKGKFMLKSQDIVDGYYGLEIKNGKNLLSVWWSHLNENIYDCFEAGAHGNADFYGVMNAGVKSNNVYNCEWVVTCSNIYYSRFLEHCNYCIWCIWLKNKEFCILNKQYSKEERFELSNKIFAQMDQDGILGKYFPATLNPFYFNDTIASLVWDFTKEEVVKAGYLRRDEEIKVDIPAGSEVVKTNELNQYQWFDSNGQWNISPEILKKVIVDEKGNSYRIIKMEYDFLMKYGLPLPALHWLERIKLWFKCK